MSTYEARLAALRDQLKSTNIDGFVVPISDEHMSEFVGSYARRLSWLTGFHGSAGSAVVLQDVAAIFTDGRYTLQVRQQVDGRHWRYESVPETSIAAWLKEYARPGARIGYDPWLHNRNWVETVDNALSQRGGTLVAVAQNPIDLIWRDRPPPSTACLSVHSETFSGKSSAAKRQEMADWIVGQNADCVVLSALDSIAWTFNIRGDDVANTPVALSFAIVHKDGTADLFIAPEKVGEDVRGHLGNGVRIHERAAFAPFLHTTGGKTVVVDPERVVAAIFDALESAGATIVVAREPAVLAKAIKNETEIAGQRTAQARDGAALVRFLHWLSLEVPKGGVDELAAAARLREFRETSGALRDLSFPTISAAGPNGAIGHYQVNEETNRRLEQNSLYLVDSGGQYLDGTTDVTRTVAVGAPTVEMRDRFTRVLKGHIAIARAVFPAGTCGSQLDTLARVALWEAGVDFDHGTGHGVGSYLAAHEGPQRIAPVGSSQTGGDEPLRAGMILSNEPGYYKPGEFGIRIENLILVVEKTIAGAERHMLGFETLTFAPIDRHLIERSLLSDTERNWIDDYHRQVLTIIGPLLDEQVRSWLVQACAPI